MMETLRHFRTWAAILSLLLVVGLGAFGCDDGDDGAPGINGEQGPPGPPGTVSSQQVAITGVTESSDVVAASSLGGVANIDVVVRAELANGTVLTTAAPDQSGTWILVFAAGPTVNIVFYDGTTDPMTELGTLSPSIETSGQGGQTIDLGAVTIGGDGTVTAANMSGSDWFISINYELGMHCTGFDFSYCCVLPPYNSVQTQVVKKGGLPMVMEGHAEEKGGHLGLHHEIMVDPDTGRTYKLKYSFDDNTYSEGTKALYFNAHYDVDGDGNPTEKGEVVSNAYWTHLYVLAPDLEGSNPSNTAVDANKAVLGIDATAAGGFPLQVPLDAGPSGQPLSSTPGNPAYMAIAGAGGTTVWTKSPVLDNVPIVLTNPGIWEALGLPLTAFTDSDLAGKSVLQLEETDIQPYQVARVTLVDAETGATVLDSHGNPVTRTGTEPIDIPNCANCHAGALGTSRSPSGDYYYSDTGDDGGASLLAVGGAPPTIDSMVQAEMIYWQSQGATQWFSELKGTAISILSLHDVQHGTRFLENYVNSSVGTGNRTGRPTVLCQKCHGDNVIGVLGGGVIVRGDDLIANDVPVSGTGDVSGRYFVVDYSNADAGLHGSIQFGADARGAVVMELNPVIAAREYDARIDAAQTPFILDDPVNGTWLNDKNLPGRGFGIAQAPTFVIPALTEAIHYNHITAPRASFRDANGRDGSCQGCHPAHRFDRSLDGYPITPDGRNAYADADNRDAAGGCFIGRDLHSNPRKDVDGVETPAHLTPVGQWLADNVFHNASEKGPSGKGIWCTNCHNQLSRILWQADNLATGEAFDPDPAHTLRDNTLAEIAAELGVTEETIQSMIDPRGDGAGAADASGVADAGTITSPDGKDYTGAPWAPMASRFGVGLDGDSDGTYSTGAPILSGGGGDFIALVDYSETGGVIDAGTTANGIDTAELTFVTGYIAVDMDGDVVVNVASPNPNASGTGFGPAPIYAATDGADYWLSAGEPHCADCHAAPFTEGQGGTAFPINSVGKYSNMRYTKGHHGIACQACHESIHGLYPVYADADGNTIDPTTYNQAAALNPDGSHGPVKCAACHTDLKTLDGEQVPSFLPASITTYDDALIYLHQAADTGGAATDEFEAYTAEEIAALQGGGSEAVCGDGMIDAGEGCDDGGTDPGDGCSATCTVEAGFTCTGEPSVCSEVVVGVCGDGTLNTGEECDDGNTADGDGCSATCTIEPLDGAALFTGSCGGCHTGGGLGSGSISDVTGATASDIANAIATVELMSGISLTSEEIDAIAAAISGT
jgi:cysteine-rich repeat protein